MRGVFYHILEVFIFNIQGIDRVKTKNLGSRTDRRAYLLDEASATTFSLPLLAIESERLEELDPLSMPSIQLVLAIDVG